jgi:hypothetical protein
LIKNSLYGIKSAENYNSSFLKDWNLKMQNLAKLFLIGITVVSSQVLAIEAPCDLNNIETCQNIPANYLETIGSSSSSSIVIEAYDFRNGFPKKGDIYKPILTGVATVIDESGIVVTGAHAVAESLANELNFSDKSGAKINPTEAHELILKGKISYAAVFLDKGKVRRRWIDGVQIHPEFLGNLSVDPRKAAVNDIALLRVKDMPEDIASAKVSLDANLNNGDLFYVISPGPNTDVFDPYTINYRRKRVAVLGADSIKEVEKTAITPIGKGFQTFYGDSGCGLSLIRNSNVSQLIGVLRSTTKYQGVQVARFVLFSENKKALVGMYDKIKAPNAPNLFANAEAELNLRLASGAK